MLNILKNLFSPIKYKVVIYKGDYSERQKQANKDKAICYVEHHFNSSAGLNPTTADYSVVIVGKNASETSIKWGQSYSKLVDDEFDEITRMGGVNGVLVGGYGGRGDSNIRSTNMPAILVEPMFCNDPEHAKVMKSEEGQDRLARVLAYSIQKTFPKGGLVAFSIGHKYKKTSPNDLGAAVVGGGWEADYAEQVLLRAKEMLE
jgi:N-acetylmuramoyl-L-alanine amidase